MSDEVKITTNNKPRELVSLAELSEDERRDFDYVPGDEHYNPRFFRYKRSVYDTGDCGRVESTHPDFKGWDGYFDETFFSGVLFKFVPDADFEWVIVGRWCT